MRLENIASMTAIDLHRSHTPSVFSAKGAVSKQPGASPQDCGWVINERCRREDKGRSHEVTPEELRGLNFANPFHQAAG